MVLDNGEKSMEESRGSEMGSIDLRSPESAVDLTAQIHHLPCCIKYDGPSSVSHYFKPRSIGVEVEGLSVKEAHFRGRKLQGTTVTLPPGYSGYVIGKKNSDEGNPSDTSEGKFSNWEMNAKFQNITLWNHDRLPSQDDAFLRSFHWFAVAQTLHNPVTTEDLESAFTTKEYV